MTSLTESRIKHIKDNLDAIMDGFVNQDLNSIPNEELFAGDSDKSKAIQADFSILLEVSGYSNAKDGIYLRQHEGSFEIVIPKDLSMLVNSSTDRVPVGCTYLQFKNYAAAEDFFKKYALMNRDSTQRTSEVRNGVSFAAGMLTGAIGGGIIAGVGGCIVGGIAGAIGGICYSVGYLPDKEFVKDKQQLNQHCQTALARSVGKDAMVDALHYKSK